MTLILTLPERARGAQRSLIGRVLPICLAASVVFFASVVLVQAQSLGTVRAEYGVWKMRCDTVPGAQDEQCGLTQFVTAEDRKNVGLSVIVLRTADKQLELLRVLAPLGVFLPTGLGLRVDGDDIGRVAFVRCLPNGCFVEVSLDEELIAKLTNGTEALFVINQVPEEGIGIPISLEGFKDGFAALP